MTDDDPAHLTVTSEPVLWQSLSDPRKVYFTEQDCPVNYRPLFAEAQTYPEVLEAEIERKAEDVALTRLIKRIEYALNGKSADQFAHRKNHLTRGDMRDILLALKGKRT